MLFAIQHIGACDIVFAGPHQRQLNLILNILDMECAAFGFAAQQCADDILG